METIDLKNCDESFDEAVRGTKEMPSLMQAGPLAIYVKKRATEAGKPAAVIHFPVMLSNGLIVRAQAVTTVALLEMALSALRGWQDGGHL